MPHRGLKAAHTSLRVLLAGSILVLALLFVYASWLSYLTISKNADARVEQAADILQEQALKVFETIDLTLADTNDILGDLSDQEIKAREQTFHDKLKQIADRLPQTGNILVIDKTGHLLVASSVFPAPPEVSFADRDYFKLNAADRIPPVMSELIAPRLITPLLFNISVRRTERDGQFNGIVAAGILPQYFTSFYREVAGGLADYFSLAKDDGSILARFPTSSDPRQRFRAGGSFARAIAENPMSGKLTTMSPSDTVRRRIVYQKISNYPVYAIAGIETSAIWKEWRADIYNDLIFGLPVTFLLFLIGFVALQRTRDAYEEVERREALEAALRQSQRLEALGQLTGGVAHDFNNLLMIFAAAGRMLQRSQSEERRDRAISNLEQAVERGRSLTRHLLSFARRQDLSPVIADLVDLMPRLRETLHATLHQNFELALSVPEGTWPIFVDSNELELAILNLAINARDAMADGGKFSISARNMTLRRDADVPELEGEFVALACADTGTGIDPEILPRIFEPFFTTKEIGKGTGMGLSQVYGFAKQSGGTVSVKTEVGQGSVFTLYLPRAKPSLPSTKGAESSGLPSPLL
ncbi:MAG TPA: ATP-binding protein [Beijerinckiaceae bacterium]|nr:ATP-binding protein [Beijerinckiaceae bacterium]